MWAVATVVIRGTVDRREKHCHALELAAPQETEQSLAQSSNKGTLLVTFIAAAQRVLAAAWAITLR